jgi:hypothetical protein
MISRLSVPVIQFDPDSGGPTLYAPFTATDPRQALFAGHDRVSTTRQEQVSDTKLNAQEDA